MYIQYLCLCAPSSNIPHSAIQISLCLNLSPVYNQLKPSTTHPENVLFGFILRFSLMDFISVFFPGCSSGTSLNVVTIRRCISSCHLINNNPSCHILVSYQFLTMLYFCNNDPSLYIFIILWPSYFPHFLCQVQLLITSIPSNIFSCTIIFPHNQ